MSKYSIPDAPPSRQDPWHEPRESASRGGQPAFEPTTASVGPAPGAAEVPDRSLGEIIRDTRNLTHEQIEKILAHQKARGVRFGEAAVALGYVNADDVVQALAQQFNYPYAGAEKREYSDELVTLNAPFSRQAEAFRGLRSQIVMRTEQDGQIRNAIAVISPNHGDGRSYIAANLAVALAQLGGRTLLVDADLRNSRQHSACHHMSWPAGNLSHSCPSI